MAPASTATLGALLRQHRLTAGLTREELAERAGLSARGIQSLERRQQLGRHLLERNVHRHGGDARHRG